MPALARGTVATLALGRTHVTAATLAPCAALPLLWPHVVHTTLSRYCGRTCSTCRTHVTMAALDHLIHTALTLYCVAVIAPRRTYSTVYLGVCMNDHGSSVRSSVERESTFKMKGAGKVPVPTLDLMPNSAKNGIGLPFGLCAPRSSSILTSPRHLEQAAVATAFRFHLMQLASRKNTLSSSKTNLSIVKPYRCVKAGYMIETAMPAG